MAASLPGVPVSTGFANFKYKPLDLSSKKPSIRLAILLPGTNESSVRVNLAHSTFADRPKYEALSYTWGPPAVVKGIELNGTRVDVRENLWSALKHLRNSRQERILWIDALCINQADVQERNHQVKLMAHIFERAQTVLVWLGVTPSVNDFTMTTEFEHLCSKPYWKRVWIVQEIGVATQIKVHWDTKSESWDSLFKRIRRDPPRNGGLALKLAEQREKRHGDGFLLANLIEVCKDSLCEEPRDKIYGFVGIAHDCHDDRLPVDYAKSLFALYEDVIRFPTWTGLFESWKHAPGFVEDKEESKANSKTLVHFSQLVQSALGGSPSMREDFARICHGQHTPFFQPSQISRRFPHFSNEDIMKHFELNGFRVTAIHAGSILTIGPCYSEIVGVPETTRKWRVKLGQSQMNIEQLREKNEGFMRVLFNLKGADLAKVFSLNTQYSWRREVKGLLQGAMLAGLTTFGPKFLLDAQQSASTEEFDSAESSDSAKARLFLSRNGLMGLIPPSAKQGDMVFQFWNSDAVAIVRREGDYLRIVGRAVVANEKYTDESKFQIPSDLSNSLSFLNDGQEVFMDIRTLQLMTQ
jgi:hypothetical protein